MVSIVTGKIHSGKTTRLLQDYLSTQKGDGFISLKVMQDGHVHQFEAMRLSTMETKVLCFHQKHAFFSGKIRDQVGDYLFLEDSLCWIEGSIQKMVSEGISPIYLDEIGALELQKKGFYSLLVDLVNQHVDLVLSVRTENVPKVIELFQLRDVQTISL